MRKTPPLVPMAALLATLCALAPARAAGTVEVKYVEPQKFSDVGFGIYDRENTLHSMTSVLQELAAQMPDGQTLKLDITDINLAGEIRHLRRGEVRVMTGRADWPEVRLRYTLVADGRTLKSGEAKVYDLAYQFSSRGIDTFAGSLPYERRMLHKWFAETFGAAH